jgi:hypothetical protein
MVATVVMLMVMGLVMVPRPAAEEAVLPMQVLPVPMLAKVVLMAMMMLVLTVMLVLMATAQSGPRAPRRASEHRQ